VGQKQPIEAIGVESALPPVATKLLQHGNDATDQGTEFHIIRARSAIRLLAWSGQKQSGQVVHFKVNLTPFISAPFGDQTRALKGL
jgi:hypothetical protein